MTARQSEPKHVSIYMLNGFHFWQKLARNYHHAFEFSKIVIAVIACLKVLKLNTCLQMLNYSHRTVTVWHN